MRRVAGIALPVVLALAVFVAAMPAAALAAAPPAIESVSASNVTLNDATLEAQIAPAAHSAGAYYQFQIVREPGEYHRSGNAPCPLRTELKGTDGVRGSRSTGCEDPGNRAPESGVHAVSLDLAGAGVTLMPDTTDLLSKVIAATTVQTEDTLQWDTPAVHTSDQTFTTPAASAPAIESESVANVTSTDATLEAQINPEGLPYGVDYQFQIVLNKSEYVSELVCTEGGVVQPSAHDGCRLPQNSPAGFIPIRSVFGGPQGQTVSLDLTGVGLALVPDTSYHYRVLAARRLLTEDTIEWAGPQVIGPDQTFTTPPAGGGSDYGDQSLRSQSLALGSAGSLEVSTHNDPGKLPPKHKGKARRRRHRRHRRHGRRGRHAGHVRRRQKP